VEKDQRDGAARGVKNTPTLFVNDVMIAPASMNKTGLHEAIDSALKASSSPKPTTTPSPKPSPTLSPTPTPTPTPTPSPKPT
jgi:hypothetical protein